MRLVVELNSCPSQLGVKRSFSIISFALLLKWKSQIVLKKVHESIFCFLVLSPLKGSWLLWNTWRIKTALKRRIQSWNQSDPADCASAELSGKKFHLKCIVLRLKSLGVHSTHAQQPCLPLHRVNDSNSPTDAFILLSFVNIWLKSDERWVGSKGDSFDCKLKLWPLCQDC